MLRRKEQSSDHRSHEVHHNWREISRSKQDLKTCTSLLFGFKQPTGYLLFPLQDVGVTAYSVALRGAIQTLQSPQHRRENWLHLISHGGGFKEKDQESFVLMDWLQFRGPAHQVIPS